MLLMSLKRRRHADISIQSDATFALEFSEQFGPVSSVLAQKGYGARLSSSPSYLCQRSVHWPIRYFRVLVV